MKKYTLFFALLASLTISPGLQAQYRWHIVHPDRIDPYYFGFVGISCSGESCSAVVYTWQYGMQNSNVILHSTDGGQTWNTVEPPLPQWAYTWDTKEPAALQAIEQIDSLDAIAVGNAGTVIRTFDGWNTWQADTFNFPPPVLFHDTTTLVLGAIDFVNVAEGVLTDIADGVNFRTVDTGQHWVEEMSSGTMHPYGNGMFREHRVGYNNDPDTILTTHDNWNMIDTTTFSWNGPFFKGDLFRGLFYFGGGDTLISLGVRFDSTGLNQIATMVRSTDLGANWSELPVPNTNRIAPFCVSPVNGQTIVIGGKDSTGEILLSRDHGTTWELDTVLLDNGAPYYQIQTVAVSGSGQVLASILTDSNVDGSNVLAYLESVPSSVAPTVSTKQAFSIFPNPATNEIQIISGLGNISILDPLGRSYEVKQSGNTLDISSLPSGVYFVSNGVSRAKFVKE